MTSGHLLIWSTEPALKSSCLLSSTAKAPLKIGNVLSAHPADTVASKVKLILYKNELETSHVEEILPKHNSS